MKTTLKKHATSVEITVTLDKKELEPARLKAISQLAGNIKVAGFRKGKVPANIAEKHIDANELSSTTLDLAVRASLPKAFETEKISPVSIPNVNVSKYVPGESAEYVATADIFPEITLGNYKKLGLKPTTVPVKPSDVDDVLARIAKSFAEQKVTNRKAKLGDEVIIDFVGKKDDVAFDGGTAKDFKLELSSGQFIPGFEEGVVGHGSGDKVALDLAFPKDYHAKDLAGAKVTFDVLVKQVNEIITPKIDDELAKKSGAFETLKDLKADIKKNIAAQNDARTDERYKDELVMKLVEASKVEAPASFVSEQLQMIRQDIERNLQSRGATFDKYLEDIKKTEAEWTKEAEIVATNRVKASLVLQRLADDLDLTVSDDEVAAKLTELKAVYKKDPNAIKQLDDPRVHADIKNRLRVEKTLDALAKANA